MATSLTLKFRIDFQLTNSPVDLKLTDLTNYIGAGLTTANMRLILWIVDGAGTTIYKNGGWSTNDFSHPDIDRSAADNKDGISLDLDSNGNPVKGEYTFHVKAKDTSSGETWYNYKKYNYQYVRPAIDIALSYSLRNSELTSRDATEYSVESISPSITRVHDIQQPTGSGANDPGSTADETRVIGGGSTPATRLWTGTWVTTITSDIVYAMETWDGSDWIKITDQITGTETIEVTKVDSINSIQTALSAFYSRYNTAIGSDYKEAQRLETIASKIAYLYILEQDAERNGGDYAYYATLIADLLSAEGLQTPGDSTTTEEVVPWGEGSGTATGNVINFVSSEPTGGSPGDMAIGEPGSAVEWNVYYNNAGTWVLKGNLDNQNAPLLNSDVTDDSSTQTTSEQVLKQYNMPASTLDTDGDYLDIEAMFVVNSASEIDISLKLLLNTTEIGNFNMSKSVNGTYVLKAQVYRTGASSQLYSSSCKFLGTPSSEVSLDVDTSALSLSSNVWIKASSKKESIGVAGDITCKYLKVQKFS